MSAIFCCSDEGLSGRNVICDSAAVIIFGLFELITLSSVSDFSCDSEKNMI